MMRRAPRGFTLIELMVVTTILGMLISMLFPAVHSARMGMRRVACLNNLRNIGQATLRYVGASKRSEFPGWRQAHQMPGVYWDESTLSNRLTVLSWGVTLLPFLDRDDLYRQFLLPPLTQPSPKLTAFLEMYVCPSDWPEPRFDNPLSYVANCGLPDPIIPATPSPLGGPGPTDSVANGVFHDLRPRYPKNPQIAPFGPDPFSELPSETFTTANLVDGADKTMMFSENLINPHYFGNPNTGSDPIVNPNDPPLTEIPADPNNEEDTINIPFRTWTGLRLLALSTTLATEASSFQENITLKPLVGRQITLGGLIPTNAGIQEWLIGMVWMPQPASTPIGGSSEWSIDLSRINRWPQGQPRRWLGGAGPDVAGSDAQVTALFLNSRPASNHLGGVNVVYCDGHTGWLRQDIFFWVYMQLMTPDGSHACNHLRSSDPDFGPWYVARQYMGTQGQTASTAPYYLLDERDFK